MKLISHRGNIYGKNSSMENKPNYVAKAINKGYNVEVDVRMSNNKLYLGHDTSDYEINLSWFKKYIDDIWIHCKDIETLYFFSTKDIKFNYFWHQTDDYTITSKGYIWTYPSKSITPNSVIVLKNSDHKEIDKSINVAGICSDYIGELKWILHSE